MQQVIDNLQQALTGLIDFLLRWTIGPIIQAATLNPHTLSDGAFFIWIIIMVAVIVFALALLYALAQLIIWIVHVPLGFSFSVRGWRVYYWVPGILIWVLAIILVYRLQKPA